MSIKIPVIICAIGGILLLGLFSIVGPRAKSLETSEPIRVRWLQSHVPADVYARATNVFRDELYKESAGTMVLDPISPESLGFPDAELSYQDTTRLLTSGDVEIASTYGVADGIEYPSMWALQLPFLFDSYATVNRVFASYIGHELLDGFSEKTKLHALAFTLSGGFRIIASDKKISTSGADLKGLRVSTSGGPVAEETLRKLDASPIPAGSDGKISNAASQPEAVETTYARLSSIVGKDSPLAKYIAETNHSLFLTTIVASDRFYDSLSSNQKKALTRAAEAAAEVEREDSIALNQSTKEALIKKGSQIITLEKESRDLLKQKTESVYDIYLPLLGERIVNGLKKELEISAR